MPHKEWSIYALKDPVTLEIRYVGRTVLPLNQRLACHIWGSKHKDYPVAFWIRMVMQSGLRPICVCLEIGTGDSGNAEKRWIEHLQNAGARLFNATEGGDGTNGLCEASRQKLSMAHRGRKFSAEHRANMSAARRNQKRSLETREAMSKAHKGRKFSAEHRANIVAALTKERGAKAWQKRSVQAQEKTLLALKAGYQRWLDQQTKENHNAA